MSRYRRTKARMEAIRDGLFEIVKADRPMSVRQIFYQAVAKGLVDKTELEYQTTVGRLLLLMRREGRIPYDWIADGTRWMRKPTTYTGLAAFIDRHQRAYRRDLWAESETYVEIWCEKEALAGVLFDVTEEYDVPLMVSRGFASESYLYSAAAAIDSKVYGDAEPDEEDGRLRPTRAAVIYYLGDYDPSGLKIDRSIEAGIRRLLIDEFGWPETTDRILAFTRIAVTRAEIAHWNLPTRPTKTKGNKHANGWDENEESVELDAIPANMLRALVRAYIENHIDQGQLKFLREQEEREREQLRAFTKTLG